MVEYIDQDLIDRIRDIVDDDRLNIERFVDKLLHEVKINRNIERVAKWNGIPADILYDLVDNYEKNMNQHNDIDIGI